jgi:hypothetical protein
MNELQDYEYVKILYEKDLPDIFGTVLDTFTNIQNANVQGQIYLWELLQRIKYNLVQDIDVETYMLDKYVDGKQSKAYEERKKQLPSVCYNARFKGYKDIKHLQSKTMLMFLDIDNFKSRQDAVDYKNYIIYEYGWIVSCNLSLSKIGLHIIILVDEIIDNDDYNYKYDYISQNYFNGYLDDSSKSLTRFTVVPWDYDIYINECPEVLDIENIIQKNRKGIRSVRSSYQKGIRSVGNHNDVGIAIEEGECVCGCEKRIICTAYTFSSQNPVKALGESAEQLNSLRFNQEMDESLFTDPDTPIYFYEGIDVMEINLHPYRNKKVDEGHRHDFIGSLTVQMIYLNVEATNQPNPNIREDLLKFISGINQKNCDPPLSFEEVLDSYNGNWKKYRAGELDFTKYFQRQRSFWSKHATLKGNEKRKVTCRIKNEPVVDETKRKIKKAIEAIKIKGVKITQKKVAAIAGLSLATVKKYRGWYNELEKNSKSIEKPASTKEPMVYETPETMDYDQDQDNHAMPVESIGSGSVSADIDIVQQLYDFDDDFETIEPKLQPSVIDEVKAISKEQIQATFNRVYERFFKHLDEDQVKELFIRFTDMFNGLPMDDARLLVIPLADVDDDKYFYHSSLESKCWRLWENLPMAVTAGNDI